MKSTIASFIICASTSAAFAQQTVCELSNVQTIDTKVVNKETVEIIKATLTSKVTQSARLAGDHAFLRYFSEYENRILNVDIEKRLNRTHADSRRCM